MISAGDFRNGVTFEMDGQVVSIIEFQHVKPGKGAAFVRTKIRNVITGAVVERLSTRTISIPQLSLTERIWNTAIQTAIFTTSWIQKHGSRFRLTRAFSATTLSLLRKYGMQGSFLQGQCIRIEPPNFVELKVTKTDPGFKGDTATNATKPATLETGAEIKVPLFIDEGEVIQIDTRTGEYMGRA